MGTTDYYETLGIEKDADQQAVKVAYRELAFKYHPDRNTGNAEAAEQMKAVNEAYAVLSDPAKRTEYDRLCQQYGASDAYSQFRKGYSDQDIFTGTDINRVFDELAKSFGFRGFDDIVKEFNGPGFRSFTQQQSGGSGRGFFFFGAFGGGALPFKMLTAIGRKLLGGGGLDTGSPEGRHLYDTIEISPELAKTGGPYAYYHRWRKKKLVIKIPSGVRHSQSIRLAGLGETGGPAGKNGDLYLKVDARGTLIQRLRGLLPF
jgi:DnaJ-class molecular chaperone